MKKLMFATALVASAAAFADAAPTAINAISFEGYSADATVGNTADTPDAQGGDNGMYFYYDGQGDGSSVKAFGSGDVAAPSITRPLYFASASPNANYLELSTEGGILWRSINTLNSDTSGETPVYSLGNAQTVAATGTYLDTLVKFTPTEDGGAPELESADKLAIWLNVDSSTTPQTTNLMVLAKTYVVDVENSALTATVVTNSIAVQGITITDKEWYRLTVKAIPNLLNNEDYGKMLGFQIFINGQLAKNTAGQTFNAEEFYTYEMISEEMRGYMAEGSVFASLAALGNSTLQGVGFKGSGALDDIVWTEENPIQSPAGIDFTLTWPSGLTAVSYTIDGGEPVAISGASPLSIPNLAGGEAITFIVQNADGAQKTLSATAADGEGIDATSTTFTWADYLGEAVNGAYEIDNLAELKLFQKGIATTTNELKLATAGETFKLTADIALDEAWPGVGVQNGKDIYSTAGFNAAAFQGTFDGQNHTISGFQMIGKGDKAEGLDYCGFFNSAYGATIQNLKIAYAGSLFAADTTASTKESGATFVGVAKNSTLRNLTTLAGTVSCSKGFGGIVGYLTSGTTVDSCTNNVNMTSLAPNKCGGIAMITQNGDAVTISNCQNNGTIAGSGETGSLVGFVGLNTTFTDCDSTVAYKLFHHNSGTVTVSGIKGNATVVSYSGTATPGLNFATVSGSVATFVADDAFALNGAYKVMAPATATFAFAEAGTISFDTNLVQAVTFAITAAQGLDAPTEATANGVVTFTVAAQGGDDYVVEIEDSDVVITPQAGDLEALQAAIVAGGGTLDVTDVAAVNAALAAPIGTTGIPSWQALFLGVAPTEAGLESFKVDSITFDADGNVVVALPDNVVPKVGRGVNITIKLMGSTDLTTWTQVETAGGTDNKTFAPVAPGSGDTKKFYKVVVEFAGSSN